MNKQRKLSKNPGWKAVAKGDSRADRRARFAATKKNSHKRVLKAKYGPPPPATEADASARADAAKAACVKILRAWLEKDWVTRAAKRRPGYGYNLAWWLECALNDCIPEDVLKEIESETRAEVAAADAARTARTKRKSKERVPARKPDAR